MSSNAAASSKGERDMAISFTTRNSPTETLPGAVTMILDVTTQQAQAIGIVMALFTGALASLAQTVAPIMTDSDDTPASWKALRIFLYSAIILNFSGAFLSLAVIKMCTDLPLAAHQATLVNGLKLPHDQPGTVSQLLIASGMSRGYRTVDMSLTVVFMSACVCTFAALTFWVLLSETLVVAGITMVVFGIVGLNAIVVSVITGHGQNWV